MHRERNRDAGKPRKPRRELDVTTAPRDHEHSRDFVPDGDEMRGCGPESLPKLSSMETSDVRVLTRNYRGNEGIVEAQKHDPFI